MNGLLFLSKGNHLGAFILGSSSLNRILIFSLVLIFIASISASALAGAVVDVNAPVVSSAKVISSSQVEIVFSEAVNCVAEDFTNLDISNPATVESISGSGTNTILLEYTGGLDWTLATGTVDLGAGIKDLADNALVPVIGQAIADGRRPTAYMTYSSNAIRSGQYQTITAHFSEDMADATPTKIELSGANTLAATDMAKFAGKQIYNYGYFVGAGEGTVTVTLSVGTDNTPGANIITSTPTSGATFIVDNTAPTTTDDYAAKDDVWQNSEQVIALAPADATSGVASTKYCTDLIDSCDPASGMAYVSSVTIYTEGASYFRYSSTDNAGNVQATVSRTVKIDTTPPTCDSLTVTEGTHPENIFSSGTDIFYGFNLSDTASFTLAASSTDDGSGVMTVNFATANLGLGAIGGGSDTTDPYNSNSYGIGVGSNSDSISNPQMVTCYDNAGNNTQTWFSVYLDNAAPTISTVSLSDYSVQDGTTVTVTSDGADAGTGVASCPAYWSTDAVYDFGVDVLLADLGSDCAEDITVPSGEGTFYIIVGDDYGVRDNVNNWDNTNIASSAIIVDNTAPVLSLPLDSSPEATSSSGAIVDYVATATDIVDGELTPDCTPASGTEFPMGVTTVTCSATDNAGNTASGSFNITVVDTTAPVLTLPLDMIVEATSALGATVSYDASASDAVDGSVAIDCSPASGSLFSFGITTVSCSSGDSHGNTSARTFKITVVDTTAPVLTLPSDITEEATSSSGATVTYSATSLDTVDGPVAVECTPASGTEFPIAVTTVTCSATDAAGNTATSDFTITVEDTTAPTYSWNSPAVDSIYADGQPITVDADITEIGSGIADGANCNPAIHFPAGSFIGAVTYSTATGKCTGTITLNDPSYLGDGIHHVTLTVADNAGNSATSEDRNILIDNTLPSVSNLLATSSVLNKGSLGPSFSVIVTYDEAMDTAVNPAITFIDGVDSTLAFSSGHWTDSTHYQADYIVSDSGIESDWIDIKAESAQDPSGNVQNPYTGDDQFKIDMVAPTITAVSTATVDGYYTVGNVIDFVLTSSEPVNVNTASGTPEFLVNSGPGRKAVYDSGTGSSTLAFNYTVGSDNGTADLSNIDGQITLNGGTIKDFAGNTAVLDLPSSSLFAADHAIVIDTTAPSISITNPADGNTLAGTIRIDATADDSTSGINRVEFSHRSVPSSIGTDTEAPYTIEWDTVADGILDGGHVIYAKAYDNAGNSTEVSVNVNVDNTAPSITVTTPQANVVYTESSWDSIDFSASDSGSGVSQCMYSVNGAENTVTDCGLVVMVDFTSFNEGRNTVSVTSVDNVGNSNTVSVSFVKDTDQIITVDQNAEANADFTEIQSAIDAASDNDTILVNDGIYEEIVSIEKPLMLVSKNGRDSTEIRYTDAESVVYVSASNATIDGFTVSGSSRSTGVYIWDAENITIKNCQVSDFSTGIFASESSGIGIDNCIVERNGREFANDTGVHFEGITDSSISNSQLNNNDKAIKIENGEGSSSNISITNNTITGNYEGIYVDSGSGITASKNKIYGNLSPSIGVHNSDEVNYLNAASNWWGDLTGPYQSTLNPSGIEGSIYGNVIFSPWCTNEECTEFARLSVSGSDVNQLAASGAFTFEGSDPSDTASLTATQEVVIAVSTGDGNSAITIPQGTVISRIDGSNLNASDLLAFAPGNGAISGLGTGYTSQGVLKWGLENLGLQFTPSIQVSIYVGTALNGTTLQIQRSVSGTDTWGNDGISPTSCVVTAGFCDFNASKASYYATATYTAPAGGTPTTTTTTTSGAGTGSTGAGGTPANNAPAAPVAEAPAVNENNAPSAPYDIPSYDETETATDGTANNAVQPAAPAASPATGFVNLGPLGNFETIPLAGGLIVLVLLGIGYWFVVSRPK